MGGIILGALGGAGEAAQNIGSTMLKNELDTDSKLKVNQQDSDLALQRAKALEDYKVATANQQREAQSSRISSAAQPIVDQGIIGRAANARAQQLPEYDGETSGDASFHGDAKQVLAGIQAMPDGPDKQAALAQLKSNVVANKSALTMDDLTDDEKAKYAPSASDTNSARTQAAIQTGDISPTDAARIASSSEITQMKMDSLLQRSEDRNSTMQQVAQVRADAITAAAQLRVDAANQRAVNGKVDTATTRMLITSEDANIRASTSQLNMLNTQLANTNPTKSGKPNPTYDSIKSQMDDLRSEIAESKQRKLDLFKGLSIVPKDDGDDSPSPSPAPAPAAAPTTKPPLASFIKN